jgi:lipoprotein-releasing system permease protein
MPYALKIALRHLTANVGQTALLASGVAVAVFIFIFMSALIGGLADLLVSRTLGNLAHVSVMAPDADLPMLVERQAETVLLARQRANRPDTGILNAPQLRGVIEDIPGVSVTALQITGGGVLIRGERTQNVSVNGLEPERVNAIIRFDRAMQAGSERLAGDSILIGETLAEDLGLSVGGVVSLRSDGGGTATLTVSGIFRIGASQIDGSSAFIDIATARSLFQSPNAVSRIEVRLDDFNAAPAMAARIAAATGLDASPWTETSEQLFDALKAQANTGLVLKAFAMITIVIGIASALMLTTYRRRSEIGIMRAMGATQVFILVVFVTQGAVIGLIGGVAGAILGFAVLAPFPSLADVQPGQLPIDVAQGSIGLAIALTTLGATLAAILPARAASRIDPVEAIGQ